MYYTVWCEELKGHHQERDQGDYTVVDPRKATQFRTWLQATARAGELMTAYGGLWYAKPHQWAGSMEE